LSDAFPVLRKEIADEMQDSIIDWLLEGDISIQYQTHRDLLDAERPDLQARILNEGWGAEFMTKQNPNGHWGQRFYQPKWISTHYTLLDLKNLNPVQDDQRIQDTVKMLLKEEKGPDGGVGPFGEIQASDVCVNGMFLNYASYFKADEDELKSIIDFVLSQLMPDGGFNCRSNRSGAHHSSLHSTISILEGITEYWENGYTYRLDELEQARQSSIEFMLQHQLFLSDKTGEIIKKDFLKLVYPYRWKYDILRALDYSQRARVPWDSRMEKAIEVLQEKRKKNGLWNNQAKHPGQVHFEMEKAGKPGRWNTLRVLRVLKHFGISPEN